MNLNDQPFLTRWIHGEAGYGRLVSFLYYQVPYLEPWTCGDGLSGLKTRTLFCSHVSQLCSLGNHGGV